MKKKKTEENYFKEVPFFCCTISCYWGKGEETNNFVFRFIVLINGYRHIRIKSYNQE